MPEMTKHIASKCFKNLRKDKEEKNFLEIEVSNMEEENKLMMKSEIGKLKAIITA